MQCFDDDIVEKPDFDYSKKNIFPMQRCGPKIQRCCACSIYWFQNKIWKNSFRGGTFVMCLTVVVVVVVSSLNSFRLYVMRACVCFKWIKQNRTEQTYRKQNNKKRCEMWIPLSFSLTVFNVVFANKNKSTTTPKCVQPATTKSIQCFSFHLISSNVFKKKNWLINFLFFSLNLPDWSN